MGDLEQISRTIEEKIKQGCDQHFHFLESAENEVEVAKIISAFANSSGGSLLIGVKKNGKTIGVDPEASSKSIDYIVEDFTNGIISFSLTAITLGRHFLLLVEVDPSEKKNSIKINNSTAYFLRVDSSLFPANKIITKAWKLEKEKNLIKEGEEHNEIMHLSKEKEHISLSYIYIRCLISKIIVWIWHYQN